MTLIVGIRCREGVVLAADRAATFSHLGEPTIRQPYKKLRIIANQVVVGTSGPVALGQSITGEIEKAWNAKTFSGASGPMMPHEVGLKLREIVWRCIEPQMKIAQACRGVTGDLAQQSAICNTLVAIPVSRRLHLFELDPHCLPELKDEKIPFVTIGSGQRAADPFLAFLRRIFWQDRQPTISEGVFTALWTVRHAIDVLPAYVFGPEQVVTISQEKDGFNAMELSDEQLEEHREAIGQAERSLANFRTRS